MKFRMISIALSLAIITLAPPVYGGAIWEIVINPTNPVKVSACGEGMGVLRSTNKGDPGTWNQYNTNLSLKPGSPYCRCIVIDRLHSNKMFAGLYGEGAYRTFNGGNQWQQFGSFGSSAVVNDLVIHLNNSVTMYAGTGSGLGAHGVYKSMNAGNWVPVGLQKWDVLSLAILPSNPDVIYAGTDGQGIFKSTNGGATWNPVNNGLAHMSVYSLAISLIKPIKIFAGTTGGVYRSQNGGNSWTLVLPTTGAYVHDLKTVKANPFNALVVAGTGGEGVLTSSSNGDPGSWSQVNNGLLSTYIQAVEVDKNKKQRMFAGDQQGQIFKTVNSGANWFQVYP